MIDLIHYVNEAKVIKILNHLKLKEPVPTIDEAIKNEDNYNILYPTFIQYILYRWQLKPFLQDNYREILIACKKFYSTINEKNFIKIKNKSFDKRQNTVIKKCSPLMTAIVMKNFQMVSTLINVGCDINELNIEADLAPIQLAVLMDATEILKLLIIKNAETNVLYKSKYNLLQLAVKKNNHDMVVLLLSYKKLDINMVNPINGKSVLHLSINHHEITKLLLSHGANPYIKDRYGRTPFMLAASKAKIHFMQSFLNTPYASATFFPRPVESSKMVKENLTEIMQESRNLVKELKFLEAFQLLSKVEEDCLSKVEKKIYHRFYYLKNKNKILSSPIIKNYQPKDSDDFRETILSRIYLDKSSLGNDKEAASLVQKIKSGFLEVAKIPEFQPFLKLLAFIFSTCERANIRFVNKDTSYEAETCLAYFNSKNSIVFYLPIESKPIYKGILMHEMTHFILNKIYHNNSKPFRLNQNKQFKKVIKDTLLSLASFLPREKYISFKDKYFLTENTWVMGEELIRLLKKEKNYFEHNAIFKSCYELLKLTYSKYDSSEEEEEFVTFYPELLGQGYSKADLEPYLSYLIIFFESKIIPSCDRLNEEYGAMLSKENIKQLLR